MKKRTFLQSLNNATEGFIHVVKNERNMRFHFAVGFLVLLVGVFLNLSRIEWMILCGAVTFVLFAEMVNTAIEELADLIKGSLHPGVARLKDISAGAVLLAAVNAIVVGFFVFSQRLAWPIEAIADHARRTHWQVTFVALIVVVFLVVAGKAYLKRGTPFRGGMPSGHSAVAFALWTTVLYTQTSPLVIGATFLLAALVAQSRLRAKIHSFLEVAAGGLLGFLVTSLFFQIFMRG